MTELQKRYHTSKEILPEEVTLVTVSKTHPLEKIKELYDTGVRIFGENRVQELVMKAEILPKDIQWHLIGHLQTNKVKQVLPFVHTIQSIDSEKLLEIINNEAVEIGSSPQIYLQVKIAKEESKFGLTFSEAKKILEQANSGQYPAINITGLMGMATFTDDKQQIRDEFQSLANFFRDYKDKFGLKKLSMGMSGDYKLAVECGSNSVRIGSAIFGERQ